MDQRCEELGRLYDQFMISIKGLREFTAIIPGTGSGDSFWEIADEIRWRRGVLTEQQLDTLLVKARAKTAFVAEVHGTELLGRFKALKKYWESRGVSIAEVVPDHHEYCERFVEMQAAIAERRAQRIDDRAFVARMCKLLEDCHRALHLLQHAKNDLEVRGRREKRNALAAGAAVAGAAIAAVALATSLLVTDADRASIWVFVKCLGLKVQGSGCK